MRQGIGCPALRLSVLPQCQATAVGAGMRIFIVLFSLALVGCAAQRALEAQDAKKQLVGMSDEKILTCMGPPSHRRT